MTLASRDPHCGAGAPRCLERRTKRFHPTLSDVGLAKVAEKHLEALERAQKEREEEARAEREEKARIAREAQAEREKAAEEARLKAERT
jgi:hypothetical protein